MRHRLRLLAAVVVPALGAAAIVLLLSEKTEFRGEPGVRPGAAAEQLAKASEVQAGKPEQPGGRRPRPAPPRTISIPGAGIRATVEPVAEKGGVLRVPDVGRAGWYDAGPRPGEVGRAVIIGHLDTREGPGLFARVPSLDPGSAIAVTDRRGKQHRYRVVGTAQVEKERFPADQVYGGADAPVLVLITCGGPFTKGEGYRDNVLLFARAVA